MAGQNHHFNVYAPEKVGYAIDRYTNETNRLYGVLNRQLLKSPFVAGQHYSIADIAIYPWIVPWKTQRQRLEEFPAIERWFKSTGQRPATVRAYEKEQSYKDNGAVSEAGKKILFGQTSAVVATAQ
jgi:GST-like protein